MGSDMPPRARPSAVALAYQGGTAPKVVAKGNGLVAEQIIQRALAHGVFVHESRELAALLMEVDLDRQIPPLLYRAIAELLAWLYHVEAAQQDGGAAPCPAPARATAPDPQPNDLDAST